MGWQGCFDTLGAQTVAARTRATTIFGPTSSELPTPYTLWSHERLLGHTELDYVRVVPTSRMGDFVPTEFGESLMPILTGVRRALIESYKSSRELEDGSHASILESHRGDRLSRAAACADPETAQRQFEALQLELRGPDGAVIPTESIGVQDTEFLLSLADEPLEELDSGDEPPAGADAEFRESAERDFAQFADSFDDLDSLETDLSEFARESWKEPTFPRYQIHVQLVDEWSIP